MKKFFVLILAILLVGMMFTGCGQEENEVSINTAVKEFYSEDSREEFIETLDTNKYLIIGKRYNTHFRARSTYDLILLEKAKNETYDIFEFSSKEARTEFRSKLDNNQKYSYYSSDGFYYLILINENTAKKSTITVKDILQNDENYIVIADNDSLLMVPKNISEFVTSSEGNTVYLETTAGTITKATFCITEEMQKKIQ